MAGLAGLACEDLREVHVGIFSSISHLLIHQTGVM